MTIDDSTWLIKIKGKYLAVKDAANQAEFADIEHVRSGDEVGSVVVHVGHPDAGEDCHYI